MSDSTWDMITSLRQFQHKPCSQIKNELQRLGTLNAYFRTIGNLDYDQIACSSAYGLYPSMLAQMMMRDVPVTVKAWWSLSIASTYAVPDRPAVIFVRELPGGEGFWAVIDGQYLIDFMRAIGSARGYQLSMQFSGGAPIAYGTPQTAVKGWFITRLPNVIR